MLGCTLSNACERVICVFTPNTCRYTVYFISIFVEHIHSFVQIFFSSIQIPPDITTTYLLCVICFRTCGHASLIDFSLRKATLSKFANRHGDVRRHAPACVDLSGWPHMEVVDFAGPNGG